MQHISLDILAIAAHPDDIEISAGGTILKSVAQGHRVGILDLTAGELGSRGSAELRSVESGNASKVLGIHTRENLGLADGFFAHDETTLRKVIGAIRRHRPRVVLCTAPSDRHPDHGRSSKLVLDACFYSGLKKIETNDAGVQQDVWRPVAVYHYIQDYYLKPDFVVDVTPFWEKKIESLKCYSSQFYDPSSSEPTTPISGEEFFEFLRGRALQMGRFGKVTYAEGFIASRPMMVEDLTTLG